MSRRQFADDDRRCELRCWLRRSVKTFVECILGKQPRSLVSSGEPRSMSAASAHIKRCLMKCRYDSPGYDLQPVSRLFCRARALLMAVSLCACNDDQAADFAKAPAADGCKFDDALADAGADDVAALGGDDFAAVYSLVLSRSCPDCHKVGGLASFLDLSSPEVAYLSLVGVDASPDGVCVGFGPRVAPGDCESSLLFRKINGEPQRCGSRMPLREGPLQQPVADLVCRWISAGARCD